MDLADFSRRADELIALADRVISTSWTSDFGRDWVNRELFAQFRTAGLSFLRNVFGSDHPYYSDFDSQVENNQPSNVQHGKGVLQAAREEIQGGWVQTATGIVSASIFTDFLEMAEYLLGEGYKDPAAVMLGSILEEHLRQLCRKHGLPVEVIHNGKTTPKKADVMNADLTKARVYGILDQKTVTSWLDLRNKAAHGRYGEYTKEQVDLFAQGLAQFMARVPV